jgi:hypothetical protein
VILQTAMLGLTLVVWVYTLVFFAIKFYNTLEYLLDDNTQLHGTRYFAGMSVLIAHFIVTMFSAGILIDVLNNSNINW